MPKKPTTPKVQEEEVNVIEADVKVDPWTTINRALTKPFSTDQIMFRIGATSSKTKKGLALAYIDARLVIDRLNEVFGAKWQSHHYDCGNGRIGCELKLFIDGEWLSRTDGAGGTAVEGDKGSFSDSLKRAAVSWGIGRYLYDFPDDWVELTPDLKRFTDEGKRKLKATYKRWADNGFEALNKKEVELTPSEDNSNPKLKETFLANIQSAETLEGLKAVGKMIGDKKGSMSEKEVSDLIAAYRNREGELDG